MVTSLLFGALTLFLIVGVPVGIALGLASLTGIYYAGTMDINYLAQTLITSVDSFPLMAVPFFILAGELMGAGGISKRLLDVANVIFGRITGGLAMVTVVTCMFFAAISGSGPATVAAVGTIIVPVMIEKGYDARFSCSLVAAAGAIGVIIPPSIPMVVYGVSTNTSISAIFMAGFIPGILIGLALIAYSYYYCKKKGYHGDEEPFTFKRLLESLNEAKWALIMPIIVLGGIYAGVFTPTEAASVSVIYGFVIGLFVYKELKIKDIPAIFSKSALTTSLIMIIIGTAVSFGRLLTIAQAPRIIAEAIQSFTQSHIVILLLINLLLLFVGCFMDTSAAIIILAPILLPIVTAIGVDPVHFAIIMVVNLSIGFLTPPLGTNLFVACNIRNLSLEEISIGVLPFVITMIIVLMLLTYIPGISLTLPRLFMN